MTDLTSLEASVLEKLLDGDNPTLVRLRSQLKALKVRDRRFTGVGFFTDFFVEGESARLPGAPSFRLSDVHAAIDGLRRGTGFMLAIDGGLIRSLECFTYEERWPDKIESFSLKYILANGLSDSRDMEGVCARIGSQTF